MDERDIGRERGRARATGTQRRLQLAERAALEARLAFPPSPTGALRTISTPLIRESSVKSPNPKKKKGKRDEIKSHKTH